MRKLYTAALSYLIAGLIAGVFSREFGRAFDPVGYTQLNTLHTHLLILGTFFFLIVLVLEKLFTLTADKKFNNWFIVHNVALMWTTGFMLANGIVHTMGNGDSWSAAFSGIAGLGHILLTVSFIWFFIMLKKRIKISERNSAVA